MKFTVIVVALLSIVGNASAFAPTPSKVTLKVSRTGSVGTTPLAVFPTEDNEASWLPKTNEAASVFAASLISVSALGFVAPPHPAFAAVQTEIVAAKKQKVPAEVASAEAAKNQYAAAVQSVAEAQKAVSVALTTERSTARDYDNALKQLEGAKKNSDVATARVKSLKSNPKQFDERSVATAENNLAKTSASTNEAQAKFDAAKTAGANSKKEYDTKQSAYQKTIKDKEASDIKVKASAEKLKEFEKKQGEVQKKAETEASEKAKTAKAKADEKAKKDAEKAKKVAKEAKKKADKEAKKQAEKVKKTKEAAKKQAEKAKKQAEKAKKEAEKAKEAAKEAKKNAEKKAKKDAENAKKAKAQAAEKAKKEKKKAEEKAQKDAVEKRKAAEKKAAEQAKKR